MAMGRQGYAYSYSYEGGEQGDYDHADTHHGTAAQSVCGGDNSLILKLHCPTLTSVKWMVKLYSLVLGGLGVILSFTWICFHLYVLSMTVLIELRQQRYLDITLGVIMLVSMLCLLYGSYSQSSHFIILFFILSLVVVIGYWTWYVYVNFVSDDYPVFEDQVGKIGLVLTLLYCMLLVPIMLLYRNMELMLEETEDRYFVQTDRLNTANNRKYPPRYDESIEYR